MCLLIRKTVFLLMVVLACGFVKANVDIELVFPGQESNSIVLNSGANKIVWLRRLLESKVKEKLTGLHTHILGKLDSLQDACGNNDNFKYDVKGEDEFGHPHIDSLVAKMKRKMIDISEIAIEDLEMLLDDFAREASEKIQERLESLTTKLNELQTKLSTLAKRKSFSDFNVLVNILLNKKITALKNKQRFINDISEMSLIATQLRHQLEILRNCTDTEQSLLRKESVEKAFTTTEDFQSLVNVGLEPPQIDTVRLEIADNVLRTVNQTAIENSILISTSANAAVGLNIMVSNRLENIMNLLHISS